MEATLRHTYYNPVAGFMSATKLYRKVKETHPNVTMKDVVTFLQEQPTWQVLKEAKRPSVYRSIQARFPRDIYQMDILVYDRYELHKYKYILCCIDVYSRYAMAVPLTNMNAPTLLKTIEHIFSVMGKPQNINFDQQFSSPKLLIDYFANNGITLYASETDELHKNAIVERFNRTLAGMLQRWRVAQKDRRWYLVLPKLTESYNNNYHRTIKAKPIDVFTHKEGNHQVLRTRGSDFNIGDRVRAKYERRTFDKGDVIKYTKEVYIIVGQPKPNRFTLQNASTGAVLKKAHKEYELIKTTENERPKTYIERAPTTYRVTRSKARIQRKTARPPNLQR